MSEAIKHNVMEEVRRAFRPEFLNRLDDILIFHRLQRHHMDEVTKIHLQPITKLLQNQDVLLTVTPKAIAWLADKGYDPAYGARPLKRCLQTYVRNPLSEKLLKGELIAGQTVTISRGQKRISFTINQQQTRRSG